MLCVFAAVSFLICEKVVAENAELSTRLQTLREKQTQLLSGQTNASTIATLWQLEQKMAGLMAQHAVAKQFESAYRVEQDNKLLAESTVLKSREAIAAFEQVKQSNDAKLQWMAAQNKAARKKFRKLTLIPSIAAA